MCVFKGPISNKTKKQWYDSEFLGAEACYSPWLCTVVLL